MTTETEVLWLDEHRVVSLEELVQCSGLAREVLLELVHGGVIPAREVRGTSYTFSARVIGVARTASRLRSELELDTPGLGVALRLLERVRDLEEEIARLRVLLPRERDL
jgi:chaperone modulatory protein CbpM